jgi:electron transfer flavoprotein alpha subunit
MAEVLVLAEHRRGELRDVTFELLTKGRELASQTNSELTAVVLGKDIKKYAETLTEYANKVLMIENSNLEHFNSDAYQKVLCHLIKERKPLLAIIGHTSYGYELAPRLAASLDLPLATDCIDLKFEDDTLIVTRQMYGGKVNVNAIVKKSETYVVTLRSGTVQASNPKLRGEIQVVQFPFAEELTEKRFIEYILPPPGAVDISSADVIVAIGRGIKDKNNIPLAEELAKSLGGVLAGSRPVIDKGWLGTDRQVGLSGRTVKPKLYIALGISGAFQHIVGMKNSDLIIAINKDANAPIFNVAHYGVVDDLFKVVPALTAKLKELKGAK